MVLGTEHLISPEVKFSLELTDQLMQQPRLHLDVPFGTVQKKQWRFFFWIFGARGKNL